MEQSLEVETYFNSELTEEVKTAELSSFCFRSRCGCVGRLVNKGAYTQYTPQNDRYAQPGEERIVSN